jgi:hypothetical protein
MCAGLSIHTLGSTTLAAKLRNRKALDVGTRMRDLTSLSFISFTKSRLVMRHHVQLEESAYYSENSSNTNLIEELRRIRLWTQGAQQDHNHFEAFRLRAFRHPISLA